MILVFKKFRKSQKHTRNFASLPQRSFEIKPVILSRRKLSTLDTKAKHVLLWFSLPLLVGAQKAQPAVFPVCRPAHPAPPRPGRGNAGAGGSR